MKNNMLIVKNDNIFSKMKNFIINLWSNFFKKNVNKNEKIIKESNKEVSEKNNMDAHVVEKENITEILAIEMKTLNNKRFIVNQICEDPDIIYTLPNERLKACIEIFKEIIQEKKQKLMELESKKI